MDVLVLLNHTSPRLQKSPGHGVQMNRLTQIRYPVWLCALVGLLIAGTIAVVTNDSAKSSGEAAGFAFVPALAGAAVGAFLAYRHNSKLNRKM